jgi:hypothetical protein
MTREVPIDDVVAVALPEGMDPHDPAVLEHVAAEAELRTWAQYQGWSRPAALRFDPIDWLVTQDADKANAFQPAHDCPACRAGADRMRAFLREHPDRWVVLGNLHYVEVWP